MTCSEYLKRDDRGKKGKERILINSQSLKVKKRFCTEKNEEGKREENIYHFNAKWKLLNIITSGPQFF